MENGEVDPREKLLHVLNELVQEVEELRNAVLWLTEQMNQRGVELTNQVERLGEITALAHQK